MALLEVERLVKRFPVSDGSGRAVVTAIDGIDLAVEAGEFFTLLGPSGCGKTTTLRSVAGLERPDEGRVGPRRPGPLFVPGADLRFPPTGAASGWSSSPTPSGRT